MIEFFQSETGIATLFSTGVTFLVLAVTRWLNGQARLIAFSPNSSFFQFAPPSEGAQPIQINSGQVMVQNLGRKAAVDVEIVAGLGPAPAGYNIVPSIDHTVGHTEAGRWIMRIPFIAAKEMITIQLLNGPMIDTIRCKDGVAKYVPVVHQRLYPVWLNAGVALLMILGLFSALYWMALAAL